MAINSDPGYGGDGGSAGPGGDPGSDGSPGIQVDQGIPVSQTTTTYTITLSPVPLGQLTYYEITDVSVTVDTVPLGD